ncbi:IclR family transcriptional regulator [Nonomuraea harbinensis]|uniref:IclR family transcriptional regulator n=1 Tax=Nonomuraea harbinensis TaxID=1286938 RepID=A0ABW1CA51_9ACTN|nr:IclR family transcriptional regulator [Nonomuraea harbinensis]
MSNSISGSTSVDRALALVNLLDDRGVVSVKEAAEFLDVTPSTAHRLLVTLCRNRFAVQDERRKYRPGPVLTSRGMTRSVPITVVRSCARRPLEYLAERLGESSHLMVLEGSDVRFVDGVECQEPLRVGAQTGGRMPAHSSAGGMVLLASLPQPELDRLYRDGLPLNHACRITELPALKRRLVTVRRQGFGVVVDEAQAGVSGVGARILDEQGHALAAMTVAMPSRRFRREELPEYVAAVRDAAALATANILSRPVD